MSARVPLPIIRSRCRYEQPSAALNGRVLTATATCSICGASFAGLAVARELSERGADVLLIDRYEIGERQTSACGIPTLWLERARLARGLAADVRRARDPQPHTTVHYPLPWTFSTFDYRTLCGLLADQGNVHVRDRQGRTAEPAKTVHTDRGDIRAAHIVDALGLAPCAGNRAHPAAGRPPVSGPRGPSARPGRGPGDLDRPRLRSGRLRLELPGRRRAPDRRRVVRSSVSRPRATERLATALGSDTDRYQGTGSRTRYARRSRTASISWATRPATACR